MPRYVTTGIVDHDNHRYPPGSEIQLSEEEARPLLACKAIAPTRKPFQKADGQAEPDYRIQESR